MAKTAQDVRDQFVCTAVSSSGVASFRCTVGACTAIIASPKSSTTNLRRHLVGHPHFLKEYNLQTLCTMARSNMEANSPVKRQSDASLERFHFKCTKTAGSDFRKLSLTSQKLTTVMLQSYDFIAHMRPFAATKDVGRRVFNAVVGAPQATVESCKDMIAMWFEDLMDTIKTEMSNVHAYALTTDGWSNYANEHFCALTLHWLGPDFSQVCCACIGVLHQPQEIISAEVIALNIRQMLDRVGLLHTAKSLVACLSDEGSNFRSCIENHLRPVPADPKLICADHLLKTSLEHALDSSPVVKLVFAACAELSRTFRNVRTLKDMLASKQKMLADSDGAADGRPLRCKPVLPVITRWGSHYDCLSHLLVLRDAMCAVHQSLVDRHQHAVTTVHGGKYKNLCDNMLSLQQWQTLRQLIDVLGPFRWLIRLAQGEYYATLAVTWANLFGALEILRQPTPNASEGINEFKAAFLVEIEKRFCDVARVPTSALIAVALDPRYHNTDVFSMYPALAAHQELVVTSAIQALLDHENQHAPPLIRVPAQPRQQLQLELQDHIDVIVNAPSMQSIQRSGTHALLQGVSRLPQRALIQIQITAQNVLAEYRALQGIPATSPQRDVLEWFRSKVHIASLKHMLELSRMYNFVPSTTAPSERVGSTAGQVYSKRRLNLAPSCAEYIVVLHESRRRVARKIVQQAPAEIMREIEAAFNQNHALSDADNNQQQEQLSDDDASVNSVDDDDE